MVNRMTDMPEKIWAYLYTGERNKGQFHTSPIPGYGSTEYTRSDIAWNEALEAAAEEAEGYADVYADFAIHGLPDNARNREAMEAAATRIAAAIRAMKREPK